MTVKTVLPSFMSAHIAQSVEHFLGKEEVTGSNPVVGSSLYGREEFVTERCCFWCSF